MSRDGLVRQNNDTIPLVSPSPRSRVVGLPAHLVRRPGPLAVARVDRKDVPSMEKRDPPAPSGAGEEHVSSSEKRVPFAVEGVDEHKVPVAEEPPADKPATAETNRVAPPEQDSQEELSRIQSKLALWDLEEREAHARRPPVVGMQPFRPSDQIHVMGMDLAGRYIAHTLAGCQTIPPVRYMLHSHYLFRQWRECGKQLTLYRGDNRITRRRVVGEYTQDELAEARSGGTIHNLIVTLPASQVVRAIGHIRHRLDYRSTICLINDGLGVAEELIEKYFPDDSTRPIFLLGHLSTNLGHTDDKFFSVSEVRPGRLFLSLFSPHRPEGGGRFHIKRHPPLERTARATHFIRLLTAMPGLHATGHPMPDFLRHKLPTAAFRTVVDPLAVLFDCRYDQILSNPYARQLMDRLIGELSHVLSHLPECRHSEKFRRFASAASLRDEVFRKLMLKRTADSRMRWQVAQGWDTDVDYLSGYFVRRGRELRASVTTLESIMAAAKAKQIITSKKLESDIPFEGTYSA
ncbi:ketopantoate reductase PanE/ApbA C terminal-domain-containing protein [Thermothelomyces heterothallicus CBS 202.75]|uniref:ketopantoate reductase PanE/ApbA C terminal-domain-containing protein n=1 Tax=Thermothelomyces heterothallicus CBS 202.75 TaxID=1149848 RepID=UPI00374485FF